MPVIYTNHETGEKIVEFEGAVLETGHQSWYDDWDELVIVWNKEKNAPESRIVYSTRFGCGDVSCKIDATDEVKAKYAAHKRELAFRKLKSEDNKRAHRVRKGSEVVVVAGRKVKKGTKGVVFWEGERRFGYSLVKTLGVAVDGLKDLNNKWAEVVWVNVNNVEVANPELTDDFELLAKAFNQYPMVKGF